MARKLYQCVVPLLSVVRCKPFDISRYLDYCSSNNIASVADFKAIVFSWPQACVKMLNRRDIKLTSGRCTHFDFLNKKEYTDSFQDEHFCVNNIISIDCASQDV